MPSNFSGTGYRPTPMPFFVSDGNGGMRLDTAGSQANVNLQNLLLEQGRPKPVLEHVVQVNRQQKVDAYFKTLGGETSSYRPNGNKRYFLPKLASPQRLHTPLFGDTKSVIDAKRAHQLGELSDSFAGSLLRDVGYDAIDRSFGLVQQRKDHLIELKKEERGLFAKVANKKIEFGQKETDWIYKPLRVAVDEFNDQAVQREVPMRFVWRKTWESASTQKVDLWVIYANTPTAAQRGPDAWLGSQEIVDPRNC